MNTNNNNKRSKHSTVQQKQKQKRKKKSKSRTNNNRKNKNKNKKISKESAPTTNDITMNSTLNTNQLLFHSHLNDMNIANKYPYNPTLKQRLYQNADYRRSISGTRTALSSNAYLDNLFKTQRAQQYEHTLDKQRMQQLLFNDVDGNNKQNKVQKRLRKKLKQKERKKERELLQKKLIKKQSLPNKLIHEYPQSSLQQLSSMMNGRRRQSSSVNSFTINTNAEGMAAPNDDKSIKKMKSGQKKRKKIIQSKNSKSKINEKYIKNRVKRDPPGLATNKMMNIFDEGLQPFGTYSSTNGYTHQSHKTIHDHRSISVANETISEIDSLKSAFERYPKNTKLTDMPRNDMNGDINEMSEMYNNLNDMPGMIPADYGSIYSQNVMEDIYNKQMQLERQGINSSLIKNSEELKPLLPTNNKLNQLRRTLNSVQNNTNYNINKYSDLLNSEPFAKSSVISPAIHHSYFNEKSIAFRKNFNPDLNTDQKSPESSSSASTSWEDNFNTITDDEQHSSISPITNNKHEYYVQKYSMKHLSPGLCQPLITNDSNSDEEYPALFNVDMDVVISQPPVHSRYHYSSTIKQVDKYSDVMSNVQLMQREKDLQQPGYQACTPMNDDESEGSVIEHDDICYANKSDIEMHDAIEMKCIPGKKERKGKMSTEEAETCYEIISGINDERVIASAREGIKNVLKEIDEEQKSKAKSLLSNVKNECNSKKSKKSQKQTNKKQKHKNKKQKHKNKKKHKKRVIKKHKNEEKKELSIVSKKSTEIVSDLMSNQKKKQKINKKKKISKIQLELESITDDIISTSDDWSIKRKAKHKKRISSSFSDSKKRRNKNPNNNKNKKQRKVSNIVSQNYHQPQQQPHNKQINVKLKLNTDLSSVKSLPIRSENAVDIQKYNSNSNSVMSTKSRSRSCSIDTLSTDDNKNKNENKPIFNKSHSANVHHFQRKYNMNENIGTSLMSVRSLENTSKQKKNKQKRMNINLPKNQTAIQRSSIVKYASAAEEVLPMVDETNIAMSRPRKPPITRLTNVLPTTNDITDVNNNQNIFPQLLLPPLMSIPMYVQPQQPLSNTNDWNAYAPILIPSTTLKFNPPPPPQIFGLSHVQPPTTAELANIPFPIAIEVTNLPVLISEDGSAIPLPSTTNAECAMYLTSNVMDAEHKMNDTMHSIFSQQPIKIQQRSDSELLQTLTNDLLDDERNSDEKWQTISLLDASKYPAILWCLNVDSFTALDKLSRLQALLSN